MSMEDETSEDDENMTDDDSAQDHGSEQMFIEPTFALDDVHEQAYSELQDAGVNVEGALGDRLHQAVEQELYQLRQEFKYGGQR